MPVSDSQNLHINSFFELQSNCRYQDSFYHVFTFNTTDSRDDKGLFQPYPRLTFHTWYE